MSDFDELSPNERARLKSRERKVRPPRMILDNAAVRRIQLALRARTARNKKRS